MNLNEIIKEELHSIINEGYVFKDDKFKFKQIINADFYNYESFSNDYDTDISTTPITVNWSVFFWLNQQGIENFGVEVNSVEGIYLLKMLDKQTDEEVQETEKNIAEIEWNFEINEMTIQYGGGLYISELDFDFTNKTCRVSFN
jgi:hypothetical protein